MERTAYICARPAPPLEQCLRRIVFLHAPASTSGEGFELNSVRTTTLAAASMMRRAACPDRLGGRETLTSALHIFFVAPLDCV